MPANGLVKALDNLSKSTLMQYAEALETLLIYVGNLQRNPDDKRYRKILISNIHFQERLGVIEASAEVLHELGFVQDGEFYVFDPQNELTSEQISEELKSCQDLIQERYDQVLKEKARLPIRLSEAHVYSSVTGAGAHSEIGTRPTMEDDEILVDSFCGDPTMGYFGLYDGHGGRQVVNFVVKALHTNLEFQILNHPNQSIPDAYVDAYLLTDGQVRRSNILHSGTTGVSSIVRTEKRPATDTEPARTVRMLYCANVGDSRAVLARGGKAVRLTTDHKPNLPEEAKRITESGGFIGKCNRVNGVLAISRALGDHLLKSNDVVTALPYTTETELTAEDTYLILACDGVWDVMEDQDAVNFVLKHTADFDVRNPTARGEELNAHLTEVAKGLVHDALHKRSQDNVTVMVIKL